MMENQEISQQIMQVLKKSHGEPTALMEFIAGIQDMNSDGKAASYPGIVRKMWPEEWKRAKDKIEFEKAKWDLLRKRRREINARLFSSDLCLNFYIKLSPEKHFEILTAPEDIRLSRLKELESNLVRERSKSRKEKILQEIVELNTISGNLALEESGKGDAQAVGHPPDISSETIKTEKNWTVRKVWLSFALTAVFVVITTGLILKAFYLRPPSVESASIEQMAFPLPDKPSIAVLCFDYRGDDPDQAYIAPAMSETLITALAKIPDLFVIAKESSFSYKGKQAKIKQISEELGVQYILEGSLQKSGDHIRVTAQLIDALKGHHAWSESYDRELKDFFALQDEILLEILNALQVELTILHEDWGRGTANPEALLKLHKGIHHVFKFIKEDIAFGRKLYQEAIALDPQYAFAYTLLGWTYHHDVIHGFSISIAESFKQAEECANKALELNPSLAEGHSLLAGTYWMRRQFDKAVASAEQAMAMDPNNAAVLAIHAVVLNDTNVGRYEEGLALIERAIRINPKPASWYITQLGMANQGLGRYEIAIDAYKKVIRMTPNYMGGLWPITVCYVAMDRMDEAQKAAGEILRVQPAFSIDFLKKTFTINENTEKGKFYIDCLRKAGIPEHSPTK